MKEFDIMERVNKNMRDRHINKCRKCKYIYSTDFCTVFQKNVKDTSPECDGSEDMIEALL